MAELSDYGITLDTLRQMHAEWVKGATKSDLERRYLGKPESHGKLFTSLVRRHLGIETETRAPATARIEQLEQEIARLTRLLRHHGIDPGSNPA